jgi:DnaJ-class molecular chaperone
MKMVYGKTLRCERCAGEGNLLGEGECRWCHGRGSRLVLVLANDPTYRVTLRAAAQQDQALTFVKGE